MLQVLESKERIALQRSLLSDLAILEHMKRGTVVIKPFEPLNLSTSSYDVTLGMYFFREAKPEPGLGVYNPYSREHVRRVWGEVHEAELAADWTARTGVKLDNIAATDYLIWIAPGETILAHTSEFIGGAKTVTTMMKARSSMGRNFIEVCKCAGWGDIGYVNRWTMEITNNSRYYAIPLVVGRRIAQIVFFDRLATRRLVRICERFCFSRVSPCARTHSDGTIKGREYSDTGKYQSSRTMEDVMSSWKPSDMLPKLFLETPPPVRE